MKQDTLFGIIALVLLALLVVGLATCSKPAQCDDCPQYLQPCETDLDCQGNPISCIAQRHCYRFGEPGEGSRCF